MSRLPPIAEHRWAVFRIDLEDRRRSCIVDTFAKKHEAEAYALGKARSLALGQWFTYEVWDRLKSRAA